MNLRRECHVPAVVLRDQLLPIALPGPSARNSTQSVERQHPVTVTAEVVTAANFTVCASRMVELANLASANVSAA